MRSSFCFHIVALLEITQNELRTRAAAPPAAAATPTSIISPPLLNCANSYAKSTNDTLPEVINKVVPDASIPRPRGCMGMKAGFDFYAAQGLDGTDPAHRLFASNLRVSLATLPPHHSFTPLTYYSSRP